MAGARVRSSSFTHGVASFDPTTRAVLLWTRVDPGVPGGAPAEVSWWVATDPEGDDPTPRTVASGTVRPDTATGIVTVDVDGLEPGRSHHYGFRADGHHSPVGRTRTLPDGSPAGWRVALCCCADRSIHHFVAYRGVASAEVDLVVHLGDYIYETSGKGGRPLEPDGACVTVDDYRTRYAQVRRDPHLMALHARHPMVAIWDDHDVADNAWRHGAKAHDPDTQGDWEARLRAAATARQEWLPARLPDPSDPLRLWRSVRVGDLAELVITDTRIDGRDAQAGDDDAKALDDPERALIGPAQREWLRERVLDRTATWCLLATQVTMSPLRLSIPGAATLLDEAPSGYALVDGDAICTDEWDGYPAERDRVRTWLAQRGGGTVVLSGDVHSAWVFDGRPRGGDGTEPGELPATSPEFVCPGVSSTPLGRQVPRLARELADQLADTLDAPLWSDIVSWGFVVLDVDPSTVTATFWFVDATDPESLAERGPTFAVGREEPGVRVIDLPAGPEATTGGRRVPRPLERVVQKRWSEVLPGALRGVLTRTR
jgi:alkaline phosphatase D